MKEHIYATEAFTESEKDCILKNLSVDQTYDSLLTWVKEQRRIGKTDFIIDPGITLNYDLQYISFRYPQFDGELRWSRYGDIQLQVYAKHSDISNIVLLHLSQGKVSAFTYYKRDLVLVNNDIKTWYNILYAFGITGSTLFWFARQKPWINVPLFGMPKQEGLQQLKTELTIRCTQLATACRKEVGCLHRDIKNTKKLISAGRKAFKQYLHYKKELNL